MCCYSHVDLTKGMFMTYSLPSILQDPPLLSAGIIPFQTSSSFLYSLQPHTLIILFLCLFVWNTPHIPAPHTNILIFSGSTLFLGAFCQFFTTTSASLLPFPSHKASVCWTWRPTTRGAERGTLASGEHSGTLPFLIPQSWQKNKIPGGGGDERKREFCSFILDMPISLNSSPFFRRTVRRDNKKERYKTWATAAPL